MKKITIILIPLLLVMLSCGVSDNTDTSDKTDKAGEVQEANKAPSFQLEDLTGNTLDSSDMKGKVVVVNFWATWCPPCIQEIPGFIKAYDEFKNDGLEILGLAVSDSEDNVRQFVKDNGVNYPVALATDAVISAFEPGNYIPSTIIIDSNGNIAHRHVGIMTRDAIVKYLEEFSSK